MNRFAVLFLAFLAFLAAGLPAQDDQTEKRYPPLPLEVFVSQRIKNRWTPPLPEGVKLLDVDAKELLDTIEDRNLVYLETDYVRIVSTVPPQRVTLETWPRILETIKILTPIYPQLKRKYPILKGKVLVHFFGVHLHRMMVDAWKVFGSDMGTYEQYFRDYKHGPFMRQKDKFEIYIFGNRKEYDRFSDRFTGRCYRDGLRHRAPVTDVLTFLLPPPPGGVRNLNHWVAILVHNWSHNVLMSEIKRSDAIPVWLDVGFAHWFERREGDYNTYCYDENSEIPRFANDDWRPKIRALFTAGKVPEFVEFFNKTNLAEFDGEEHAICFALMDYIIRERVTGMRPFCDIQREKPGSLQDHFREAWGESPMMFYEKFRAWVKENYSKKGLPALREPPRVLGGDPDRVRKKAKK